MSYYYGQLNQPLTAEQIADQESMNRVAQVLGKSTAMAHTQLLDVQLREAQKAREASKPKPQHFDTEAHRAFMRSLG